MTTEKFTHDAHTVLKFTQIYCNEKHQDAPKRTATIRLCYKGEDLYETLKYTLCSACEETLLYSYKKLQECPYEEKPSCRKCASPCYEKTKWKSSAKIMKYSGMRLGLIKIKKLFRRGA